MEQKTFFIVKQQTGDIVEVATLKELNKDLITENNDNKIYFAFSDTSASDNYPGWPLRNYIALILYHW